MTTAFDSFFRLANIQPGEIVCDPMCGGGSIPIEGALAFNQGFFFGGDFHEKASERTGNNLKHHNRKLQTDCIQWDATNIPMRDNCVDVLVSDLVSQKFRSVFKIPNISRFFSAFW